MFLINSYFNILDGILAVICEVIPSTVLLISLSIPSLKQVQSTKLHSFCASKKSPKHSYNPHKLNLFGIINTLWKKCKLWHSLPSSAWQNTTATLTLQQWSAKVLHQEPYQQLERLVFFNPRVNILQHLC